MPHIIIMLLKLTSTIARLISGDSIHVSNLNRRSIIAEVPMWRSSVPTKSSRDFKNSKICNSVTEKIARHQRWQIPKPKHIGIKHIQVPLRLRVTEPHTATQHWELNTVPSLLFSEKV